jgi:hypothetical protein
MIFLCQQCPEERQEAILWRPVTAIRNGDLDGNDATERDPMWEPFIPTPMHPEYPCADCINSAAGTAVLEAFFGDTTPPFSLTSPTATGVTRRFSRLSDYVSESIDARVYDGVHYHTFGAVGAAMGRNIGAYTGQNYLKPVSTSDSPLTSLQARRTLGRRAAAAILPRS